MAHTTGISVEKDAHGRNRKMIVDLTRVSAQVQDLIDGIISDLRRNQPAQPAEKVFKRLDKKFKIRSKVR